MNGFKNTDVLVIGAGPSGSVAASYLHKFGINVLVVEKSNFPRFVIGESLLPRSMEHFEAAGLLDCLKAKNFEVKKGARFLKNGKECRFRFSEKFTDGWDWTWQVPRAEFDKTLTDELQRKGVQVLFEHEVASIEFDAEGNSKTQLKNSTAEIVEVEAKFILDCSGFGRVLPRLLSLEKESTIENHAAIFTHVIDKQRPEGEEGTLITFDILNTETWLWVIPFSDGNTSLGVVAPTDFLNSFTEEPTERFNQLLKLFSKYCERFHDAELLFEPKQLVNFSKSTQKMYGKGYAIAGNSAAFLDPVFSSGVAFATESAISASKLILAQLKGEKVDWQTDYENHMREGISVFSTYVKEWYTGNLQKIFFHETLNPEIKKQICSVLAGYVWDKENPFVKNHHRLVKTVAQVIDLEISTK